jgi:hypothetical protein
MRLSGTNIKTRGVKRGFKRGFQPLPRSDPARFARLGRSSISETTNGFGPSLLKEGVPSDSNSFTPIHP